MKSDILCVAKYYENLKSDTKWNLTCDTKYVLWKVIRLTDKKNILCEPRDPDRNTR